MPKGLRSFDANDADFFLELLPGPRDRDGLPESIRFWKMRVEETDPNKRQWGQQDQPEQFDQELATGQVKAGRQWYVNK